MMNAKANAISRVTWNLRPVAGGGWQGEIVLPCGPAAVTSRAKARTKAGAMKKTAALAERVLADPMLAQVIPPQAQLAIRGAKMLAQAAQAGQLKDIVGKLKNPALKKIGKSLLKGVRSLF